MINRPFHPNPRFSYMSFNGRELTIGFKKGQIRVYICSAELAYGLFYCKSSADELSFYSNKIKKLCNVADVINPK